MGEGLLLPEPCRRIAAWASPGHRFGVGCSHPAWGAQKGCFPSSPPPLLTPASGGKTLLMCLTNDVCISQPLTCECVRYERWGVTCRSEGLVVCNSHVFSHTESGCQKTARAFVAWRCFLYVRLSTGTFRVSLALTSGPLPATSGGPSECITRTRNSACPQHSAGGHHGLGRLSCLHRRSRFACLLRLPRGISVMMADLFSPLRKRCF